MWSHAVLLGRPPSAWSRDNVVYPGWWPCTLLTLSLLHHALVSSSAPGTEGISTLALNGWAMLRAKAGQAGLAASGAPGPSVYPKVTAEKFSLCSMAQRHHSPEKTGRPVCVQGCRTRGDNAIPGAAALQTSVKTRGWKYRALGQREPSS